MTELTIKLLVGFLHENADEFAEYLERKEIEGSESYVIINELAEALEVRCE